MYKIKDLEKSAHKFHTVMKVITIILCIIIIPIIIYNLTLMVKSMINPNETPSFFGIKTFVIISESMEPNIMPGDAIFVKQIPKEEIKEGDIISFHDKDFINTHRVVEIINESGVTRYRTKGDNNTNDDRNLVYYKDIEGKYLFRIKGFGKVIEIIQNRATLIVLLIILVIILTYQVRINKRRLQRKEKRYEYNKKLLKEENKC